MLDDVGRSPANAVRRAVPPRVGPDGKSCTWSATEARASIRSLRPRSA